MQIICIVVWKRFLKKDQIQHIVKSLFHIIEIQIGVENRSTKEPLIQPTRKPKIKYFLFYILFLYII